ncbi:hypothetical protein GCM10009616_36880 [Microlunatus lacustris]
MTLLALVHAALVLTALVQAGLQPLFLLLEASPSPVAVYPPEDSGFAYATVVGGFFAVGLLSLIYFLLNLKPKRREPYRGPND